jgi:hypothetical protein
MDVQFIAFRISTFALLLDFQMEFALLVFILYIANPQKIIPHYIMFGLIKREHQ